MNGIFKSSLGFHIDLSKIVAISAIDVEHPWIIFRVDVQLMDQPYTVGSFLNKNKYYDSHRQDHIEHFDKEVRQELIDAWIAYNEPRMAV